jgi:hypothetical protein
MSGTLAPIKEDEYIKLWPNQFFGLDFFINPKDYNINKKGKYKIIIIYSTGKGIGLNRKEEAFSGTLEAAPITIKIK